MHNTQILWQTGGRLASVLALLVATHLATVPAANAQECVVTRGEVLEALEQGLSDIQLARRYAGCTAADAPDNLPAPPADGPGSKQVITNTGSVRWEALTSCGYHPQRKELTCPIEIRRRGGYGGVPALQPVGSFEYVLFCVDTGAGLQPVNVSGVHVHDEAFGVNPRWYLSAVVAADGRQQPGLFSSPLDGTTLRARAILSWAINPFGNCQFAPVWGNQADFRIRLDP